jgi:hypothetical protein
MGTYLGDMTGQRFGMLTVVTRHSGCDRKIKQVRWICQCECGNVKIVNGSNLRNGKTNSCGCTTRGVKNPSYNAVHGRLRAQRGAASKYICVGCEEKRASDWAYDHEDPNEKTGIVHGSPLLYSADPEHYKPMCHSCHMRFDAAFRRTKKKELSDAPC